MGGSAVRWAVALWTAIVVALSALAVGPSSVVAQVTDTTQHGTTPTHLDLPRAQPRRDTTVNPLHRPIVTDSGKNKAPRPDSIQARFSRGLPPLSLEIGESYTYTRDQLFASGALTLTDLLNKLPGVETFQTGWISSPQVAAYYGDMSRLEIYYDGVRLDNLDTRNGNVPDLSSIPIWSIDHITLTRGANSLRVDLRSWEYNNTTPYTRVDVLTGDLSTDMYRAFYGKRFYNGADLQIGAQQFGTTDNHNGGGGQTTTLFGRYGIARQLWSMDVTVMRTDAERAATTVRSGFPSNHPIPDEVDNSPLPQGEILPNYTGATTLGYLRASIGHPDQGPFLQFIASTLSLRETSSHIDSLAAAPYGFPPDTVDSAYSESQYVLTAGTDVGGLRLRLIDRYRTQTNNWFNSVTGTADYTSRFLSLDALAERDPYYGYTSVEGGARVSPLPFLALSAYVGQRNTDPARTIQPDSRSMRLEGGIRLFGGTWLSVGVLSRDTAVLIPPIVFDSAFRVYSVGHTSGYTYSLRGPLTHGFSVDITETHWPKPTPYVPSDQFHGELQYYTDWLSRFPKGNFSFKIVAMMDYRSEVAFPEFDSNGDSTFFRYTGGVLTIPVQVPIYSVLAEIKILRGIITYQRRNATLIPYDQVPGYLMPKGVNLYGVRWYFFE